jgi:hypothetical protein
MSLRTTVGFHIHWAKAIRARVTLTVTTILVISAVLRSPRMMPTCNPAPNSGANTKRTRIKASGAGQFQP